jgi:hypothetical protein
MKNLYESILDDIEDTIKAGDKKIEEYNIREFIKKNYEILPVTYADVSNPIEIRNSNDVCEVIINGRLNLKNKSLKTLTDGTFRFKTVNGIFDISDSNIETLENCPETVDSFYATNCTKLKSLQYCPKCVDYLFEISGCTGIKNLKYMPERIGSFIDVSGCSISNLRGLSKVEIMDLAGLCLVCKNCDNLKDLSGCHKKTATILCSDCKNLESFKGCPNMTAFYGRYSIDCSNCPKLMPIGLPKKLNNGINIKGCPLIKKEDIRKAGCVTVKPISCDPSQETINYR